MVLSDLGSAKLFIAFITRLVGIKLVKPPFLQKGNTTNYDIKTKVEYINLLYPVPKQDRQSAKKNIL